MEFNFKEGKVTKNDTALKIGSGDLEVYATPAMIALMENASKSLVINALPDHYTTVGIEMNVKHIKASLVGANIKCSAILIKADGKKLFFDIEASDDEGIIGKGSHIRYVVNSNDFINRIKK